MFARQFLNINYFCIYYESKNDDYSGNKITH